jgi:hypothetical protein
MFPLGLKGSDGHEIKLDCGQGFQDYVSFSFSVLFSYDKCPQFSTKIKGAAEAHSIRN